LLRALADSPARIDAVASLVDDLAAAGPDVLPAGFLEIWQPIRANHRPVRSKR
jgi:hypothetical protein